MIDADTNKLLIKYSEEMGLTQCAFIRVLLKAHLNEREGSK